MISNGKTETLYLICDTSGSMNEDGKNMLTRGIARAVEQYIRFNYASANIQLILWNTNVSLVDWNPDEEFPDALFQCGKSANCEVLCETLGEKPDGKILLLTDGWWSRDDLHLLKRWNQKISPDTLRVIKIGSDANPLIKGENVFSADDFFSALENWLPQDKNPVKDEDEDEWE